MFLAGWDGEADSTTTTTNCPVYLNRFIRPGRAAIKSSSQGGRYLGETNMGRAGLAVVEGKSPTRENRPKQNKKNSEDGCTPPLAHKDSATHPTQEWKWDFVIIVLTWEIAATPV